VAPQLLQEESPRWLQIMAYLQDNGAAGATGLRMKGEDLGANIGIPWRTVKAYLRRMELLGVIQVVRTTIDGSFGSPRGPNIYYLRCSVEQWRDELGPKVADARRERTATRKAKQLEVRVADRKRVKDRVRAGRMDGSILRQTSSATPPPGDASTIELLTQEFLAEDDLAGW
jgi:hypothetical protein